MPAVVATHPARVSKCKCKSAKERTYMCFSVCVREREVEDMSTQVFM